MSLESIVQANRPEGDLRTRAQQQADAFARALRDRASHPWYKGPPLLIGYILDKHYQSLLPKKEDAPSMTNRITLQALRTALDSLQLDPLEKRSEVGSNCKVISYCQISFKHLSCL